MKKVLAAILFLFLMPALSFADGNVYQIDAGQSSIKGSIKYTVLGRYEASFKKFSGTIEFDPNNPEKCQVDLVINADSIKSSHPKLDRIVRSKKLLNTAKHPTATFKSKKITKGKNPAEYVIVGDLTLCGKSKQQKFSFMVEGPYPQGDKKYVHAKGKWVINRKEFDVVWNKLLDQAGIIVGNHVTLEWEMIGIQ